ncbi:MAG: Asp-tRNA(Asn)/Glu-tRNA(Gln) amidotransferase subunit GatB [Erysipelotrichaceae bacterium]|nr:Asp-tRNA(Asn)/Glu-tRNA(Gln) amidotransferase subunit GatB [Erysipelotrichaceae bacterium]
MNFEAVIGIEIHVEMKTKSKMFSSAPVLFGAEPNTLVRPLDIAFPGTMPLVNKQAVINAIRVSNALHMSIDNELWFDRKNYFYSDLPKGFQITQDKRPIGRDGYVEIKTKNGSKRIEIERLHMEEDTCKQLHMSNYSLLDYNRAGTPLVEIVSRPNIRSGEEAMKYVEQIKSIVQFTDVSDGKMEEGSLRCDVNISLRPIGSEKFGTKVEIKNLNSLSNVEKAIEFEIIRQQKLLLAGIPVEQETRRFDEMRKETVLMRKKTDAVDYKYFTEPNITPIKLSDEFIKNAIETCPELASSKRNRYINDLKLSEYDADILLQDKAVSEYFDKTIKYNANPKLLVNWIMVDIASYLNKNNYSISDLKLSPEHLSDLVKLISEGKISSKQAKDVFLDIVETNASPIDVANKLGIVQMSDENAIMNLVIEALNENPQAIEDFKNGKDRAVGFLVGQIMKKSRGKANPAMTSKLVIQELKKR